VASLGPTGMHGTCFAFRAYGLPKYLEKAVARLRGGGDWSPGHECDFFGLFARSTEHPASTFPTDKRFVAFADAARNEPRRRNTLNLGEITLPASRASDPGFCYTLPADQRRFQSEVCISPFKSLANVAFRRRAQVVDDVHCFSSSAAKNQVGSIRKSS